MNRIVSIGLLLIVLLAFGAAGCGIIGDIKSPLAEPLELEEAQEPESAPVVVSTSTAIAPPENPAPAAQAPEVPVSAEKAEGACGETGSLTILFIGADHNVGEPPPGADAVRLFYVDFDTQTVQIVAIPRDLWLPAPTLNDASMPAQTIGLAYHTKNLSAAGEEKAKTTAATQQVAQMLLDAFGVRPDHYFTLQVDVVANVIDTLDGVTVSLPAQIVSDRNITFPAGENQLNGAMAAEFVRTRLPGGETDRMERQNLFTKALLKKFVRGGWILKTPQLFDQFSKSIVTDLSIEQIASLACMSEAVSESQILFHALDGELLSQDTAGNLVPNGDKARTYLQAIFGE